MEEEVKGRRGRRRHLGRCLGCRFKIPLGQRDADAGSGVPPLREWGGSLADGLYSFFHCGQRSLVFALGLFEKGQLAVGAAENFGVPAALRQVDGLVQMCFGF